MRNDKLVNELREAMVGWTVADVVEHDAYEGAVAEFVLRRGQEERRIQLCANDLGAWLRAVKTSRAKGPFIHRGERVVENVLDDITTHLMQHKLTDLDWEDGAPPDPYPLEVIDGPVSLTYGFRCPQTGAEWHLHIRSLKGHRLSKLFSTVEGRQEIVRRLVEGSGFPWEFTEPRQDGSATQG